MTALLEALGVARRFGKVRALDGVSLSVSAGERVALLGHNGAGKSTMFRLVLGFIRPDAGSLLVDGAAPGTMAARSRCAFLPENVSFPKSLTGRELILFYASLKGVPKAEALEALDRVGLSDAMDRAAGGYSKGMRQRLGLAQALIGSPRLLLLDEPTTGLDPLSRRDFYALLDEAARAGAAVLLSSHSLGELESRVDRVVILRQGKVIADASLAELQAETALPIRLRVKARPDAVDQVQRRLGGTRVNGQAVELVCQRPEKMTRLAEISALAELVTDFEIAQPSLDEIYEHYSRSDERRGE